MNHRNPHAWLASGLLAFGFLLLAGTAQAYEYRDDFEGWPSDLTQCDWLKVYGGGPSACNGTGLNNPQTFQPQECRSGSRCIPFSYGSKDETHNIYPKMNGSTTGTVPAGWKKGGYFSYFVRYEPGFVWPENSIKASRITADSSTGLGAMLSEIQWDGTRLSNRMGGSPETSCDVNFPFHAKNGQWIRMEWWVDRPNKTVKSWVTSEDGTTSSCVNTNMNAYEDSSGWDLFWLGGNYSSNRSSGSGFGGRGAWDDICLAETESARNGFCAPDNFPLGDSGTGGGSIGGGDDGSGSGSGGDDGSGSGSGGGSGDDGSGSGSGSDGGSVGGGSAAPGGDNTIPCSQGVDGLLFCDGFDRGAWEGFSDGGSPISVTSDVVGYGTHALETTIPAGSVSGGYLSAYFADHPLRPGGPVAKVDDLWFSVRVRFDSGFDHSGQTKIATVGAFEDWGAGYPGPWSFAPYYMSVMVDTDRRVFSQIHRKTSGDVWNNHGLGEGTPLQPDTWHDLVFHLKLNSPGKNDGVIEMWTDGVKGYEIVNANFRDSYDDKGWNVFTLSSYHSGDAKSASTQYWDELVITDSPIGEAQPVQPLAAPVLLP